jgi:hypothetical protein
MSKEEYELVKSLDLNFNKNYQDGYNINFKCLCCHEGKSYNLKSRMFYLNSNDPKKPSIIFCHNCGYSKPLKYFLSDFFPQLAGDYRDIIRESTYKNFINSLESEYKNKAHKKIDNNISQSITFKSIFRYPNVLKYVKDRMISRNVYKGWYGNKKAAIIPLLNEKLTLFGYQYRYLEGSFRYKTVIIDNKYKKIYNWYNNRELYIASDKDIYITEGVFDTATFNSLNLHSIAILGASIPRELLSLSNIVIVLDNDDRGKLEIKKLISQYSNLKFLIIDSSIKCDINDYYIQYGREKTLNLINNSIKSSLELLL